MLYCPYCGMEITEDMMVCKECGFKLRNEPLPERNAPEEVAEPVNPAPVEPTPAQPEPEPVKPEPKLEKPVPPAEPRAKEPKNTGSKSKNPHLIGVVVAVLLIVVGIALINVPPSETSTDDSPYALVAITVINSQDETLDMTSTDGTNSYLSYDGLQSGYYMYSANYYVVKLSGNSQTVTFTATGISSSGEKFTDDETLTLRSGEEYKIVLRL